MVKKIAAALALLAISSTAFGAHIESGSLDVSDPLWDGCGSGTGCYYDVLSVTVLTDGLYSFTAEYAGNTSLDENLDGIIELYEGAFDPSMPGVNGIAFDDDYSDTGGFPSCVGQNCSQISGVSLIAGNTYFLVISSFTNTANSFGQPTGDWMVTGLGPNGGPDVILDPAVVPVPAAVWLMLSGLLGLGAMRRRAS